MSKTSFTIEAIVSCDERGQLVLPKEVRKALDIQAGDKLALLKYATNDEDSCLTIIKSSSLEDLIRGYLGPMLRDMAEEK